MGLFKGGGKKRVGLWVFFQNPPSPPQKGHWGGLFFFQTWKIFSRIIRFFHQQKFFFEGFFSSKKKTLIRFFFPRGVLILPKISKKGQTGLFSRGAKGGPLFLFFVLGEIRF